MSESSPATPPATAPEPGSAPASVVVVGAGVAGWRLARDLRGAGFAGTVTVLGDEAPYDRPPLSKQYLAGEFDDARISLFRGEEPESLDVTVREVRVASVRSGVVTLDDGEQVEAEAIVVATGSSARRPAFLDGHDVHTLRTRGDAQALRTAIPDASSLLVLGGGFIGAEVAATARAAGLDVTIVELQPYLLGAALGPECGARLEQVHTDHGVELVTGSGVERLESTGGATVAVLADGRELTADVVVAGFGASLNLDVLADTGLDLADGVICDATGRVVGLDGVWAVGDIAAWHDPVTGRPVRREHWQVAGEQASLVARAIAGTLEPTTKRNPPYFWSDQFDVKVQVFGRPELADRSGWLEADDLEPNSVWAHHRGEHLVGVVTFGVPRLLGRFRPLVTEGLAAVATS
ncbi:MAG: FAD-dependent oxidoreductase [Aeromicrobium sp.]|uniref:NAD(P)/FAD-dependent oxidoreductase n=1 Tax=Aeromicrobium sp. TaxID=1871063 RepID=UPI002620C07C|nr:FAD-dependent oxidoreductase [Aeromicrobium sp.]MDF1705362.1 FAD-dependent oxidoreductase [Aeromicrobium sp.]